MSPFNKGSGGVTDTRSSQLGGCLLVSFQCRRCRCRCQSSAFRDGICSGEGRKHLFSRCFCGVLTVTLSGEARSSASAMPLAPTSPNLLKCLVFQAQTHFGTQRGSPKKPPKTPASGVTDTRPQTANRVRGLGNQYLTDRGQSTGLEMIQSTVSKMLPDHLIDQVRYVYPAAGTHGQETTRGGQLSPTAPPRSPV